jgi:glycopeptide antibiotics resistance protein
VLLWCASFSLEVAQGLTQYRTFSVADAIANGAGLLIGFLIVTLWDIIIAKYRINSVKNRIHAR